MAPRNKKGGTPATPPTPPPPPKPTTWADVVDKNFEKIPGLLLKAGGIAGATIVASTPEGREAVKQTAGVLKEYGQFGWSYFFNSTSELAAKIRSRIGTLAFLLLLGLLISAFSHHFAVRLLIYGLVLMPITYGFVVVTWTRDVKWFAAVGAAKDGFPGITQEAVNDLLHLNPFTLIFGATAPAVTGAVSLLWGYGQLMFRIGFYSILAYAYMMLPWWHHPLMVAVIPPIIMSFISLGTGFNLQDRVGHWKFYLSLTLLAMTIFGVLTFFPQFADWAQHVGWQVELLLVLSVGAVLYWLVMICFFPQAAGGGSRRGGSGVGLGANAGRILVGALIFWVVIVLLGTAIGQRFYKATDHLTKNVGLGAITNSQFAHDLGLASAYPLPDHGGGALPGVTAPDNWTVNTSGDASGETSTYRFTVPVKLGPLGTGITVLPGDQVAVTCTPDRVLVYDDQGRSTPALLDGGYVPGGDHLARPEDFADLQDQFGNDYVSNVLPLHALLARIGVAGTNYAFVGTRGNSFTVAGNEQTPQALQLFLNEPQIKGGDAQFLPNQRLTLTITVRRPRRA